MNQIASFVRRAGESALFRMQRLGAYRYLARRLFAAPPAIRSVIAGDEEQLAGLYGTGISDLRESFRKTLKDDLWLVAEQRGRIAGSVVAAPLQEDPRAWMIYSLFVRPMSRRLGIGAGLVEAVVRKARSSGASAIGLFVNKGSYAPAGLYRKLGFEQREPLYRDTALSASCIYLERRF